MEHLKPGQDLIDTVYRRVNIEEGMPVIERLFVEIYFQEGISTKELARKVLLPVPLVAAIKKEFIKEGLLVQDRGIRLSPQGLDYAGSVLGFKGLDLPLYHQLLKGFSLADLGLENTGLREIFADRPQADVTLDQSKATLETSFKRAVLSLQNHTLIGKKILCAGDDDLVSIALGFLLKKLYPDMTWNRTEIHVIDIDRRFLEFIAKIAESHSLPVICHHRDLRNPLPQDLDSGFDCFYTDPPYTVPGMSLFLSRGIAALKKLPGLPVFLSFAHKPPNFSLRMQQEFLRMGLVISEMIPRFNEYEGAEIIGNTGQMIVLRTSRQINQENDGQYYSEAIYTGELKRTIRTYQCKQCSHVIKVGTGEDFTTIEEAKEKRCPRCRNVTFDLIERTAGVQESSEKSKGRDSR
jgi:predicted methyltransferase